MVMIKTVQGKNARVIKQNKTDKKVMQMREGSFKQAKSCRNHLRHFTGSMQYIMHKMRSSAKNKTSSFTCLIVGLFYIY